jgi:signal transduction histidine kinase/ActR/RegA family two-component response regulator
MTLIFMRKFHEKFGFKVFAAFIIFIFVISTSFAAFFIHKQRQFLTNTLIKNGILLARILAYNSRIGVFSENEQLLNDPVEGIFQKEEVLEVTVFNLEGGLLKKRTISRTDPDKESGDSLQKPGKIRNEIFDRLRTSLVPFYLQGSDTLEFWSPVISGSSYLIEGSPFFEKDPSQEEKQVIGFVMIKFDKAMFNKGLHALLLKSILIGFVFLIIGSVFVYLVANGITRPLKKLTEGVKALGMGGVVNKIPVETNDEVGKLAEAFNNMSESLKRRESEQQRLEEQLRHAQKIEAIGTLSGGIAHDFNNILGIIVGYTDLALLEVPEGTSLWRKLNEVIKASSRAKDLVNQILTFSRQREQERRPIQISFIIKEVLKMLRASLPTTIEIRKNINAGLGMVLSDPTQIHQVLMNLCTNAAHAMREKGGVLEVTLSDIDIDSEAAAQHLDLPPGQYQKLMVSDTGHGMDAKVMERIFEPFFTTKGPGEGTGMGLSVVHGIVKSLGGEITVKSRPGEGSTFEIFLPRIKSEIFEEPEDVALPPHGNERILFVDDEEALVGIGQQMLENLGYDVVARTSSIEALNAFRAKPDKFDLLISDVTMPNMTGPELAKAVLHIRPDIPIILCTGFSDSISKEKAKAIGIQEFIMKPIVQREIADVIRRILDGNNGSVK